MSADLIHHNTNAAIHLLDSAAEHTLAATAKRTVQTRKTGPVDFVWADHSEA